jgi:class 3 adenylate cyclase
VADDDVYSQLSRYETLYELSARVNTDDTVEQAASTLASRLKYVVDIFAWRYLGLDAALVDGEEPPSTALVIDGFRAAATISTVPLEGLAACERDWLAGARMQLIESDAMARSLPGLPAHFARDDLAQLYIHPELHDGALQGLFVFAKRRGPLSELDHKFLRALAKIFHDKIHHLRRDALMTDALKREIGEREAAQHGLEELNAHLEERVAERTAELAEKNRMLVELTDSFGRFVPLEYLEFLDKQSILDVHLGDHVAKEMAVLFSDIRSFTTLSERMTPQENFDFINTYLRHVSPVVRDAHGIIVKFLGDGMMAIFPRSVEDAVVAGVRTLQRVAAYNAERVLGGAEPIEVGIGVHVGHMMVGMVGEESRLQGDAFSDTVNLTQRVEGLTKHYGASMIVTGEVLEALGDGASTWRTRHLDRAIVKGREEPIEVHEVLDGLPQGAAERRAATSAAFARALEAYGAARFDEARRAIAEVIRDDPTDRAATLYAERVDALIEDGAPESWDPVARFTVK